MTAIPPSLAPLLDRPAAIFGFGASGRAAADLLASLGVDFLVYDEDEGKGVRRTFTAREGREHSLVLFSPGFSPRHSWLETARGSGCACLSELDFASLFWKGKIIAVTGTNGKTTLSEFLAYALKRYRRDAVAVGNNGFPLSRLCLRPGAEDWTAVCEISSFQAETLQRMEIDALLWTNMDEDHLDRYESMREYFAAKERLLERLARPVFFAGESVVEKAGEFGFTLPDFTTVVESCEKDPWLLPAGSVFGTYPQRENLRMARAFWKTTRFPEAPLRAAAERFPSRKHRLQKICEREGISFWNDSKATNFSASLAAISEFNQPVLWIGGGQGKGGDLKGFAKVMAERVKAAFLIGEAASAVETVFRERGGHARRFPSMEEAVRGAFERADRGDAVLLSPGFSSYDMFENYAQRGICFKNAVLSLKEELIHP